MLLSRASASPCGSHPIPEGPGAASSGHAMETLRNLDFMVSRRRLPLEKRARHRKPANGSESSFPTLTAILPGAGKILTQLYQEAFGWGLWADIK
jgi:hypothetical protein